MEKRDESACMGRGYRVRFGVRDAGNRVGGGSVVCRGIQGGYFLTQCKWVGVGESVALCRGRCICCGAGDGRLCVVQAGTDVAARAG